MGLRLTVLGSGSSGNATLVSDGSTHVLIDIGLSGREAARRLRECGVEPREIAAVVVSHEHGDHCRGVAPFVKDLDVPVFMTAAAFTAADLRIPERNHRTIVTGMGFEVDGLFFTPFAVPHDAADPIGLCVEKDGVKIGVALDLGYMSALVVERFKSCDAIVLESNHDVNMLKVGPYPWALKQRVMSRRGHLSNDSVAAYLAEGFDGGARHFVLAHLSKKNNLPELAMLSARQALEERSGLLSVQTRLVLAEADRISQRLDL